MSLIHLFADGLVVSLDQSVADGHHSVFLLDDEFGALEVLLGDLILDGEEHLHVGVAQGVYAECLGYILA